MQRLTAKIQATLNETLLAYMMALIGNKNALYGLINSNNIPDMVYIKFILAFMNIMQYYTGRIGKSKMKTNLITIKQAAEILGVSTRWIFKLIEAGKLTPVKIGGGEKSCGMNLIPKEQIEFLKSKVKNGGVKAT